MAGASPCAHTHLYARERLAVNGARAIREARIWRGGLECFAQQQAAVRVRHPV